MSAYQGGLDPVVEAQILDHIARTLQGYGKVLEDEDRPFWMRALGARHTPQEIENALLAHVRESRLAPRPSDVLRHLAEGKPAPRPPEPRAPDAKPLTYDQAAAWRWLLKQWKFGEVYAVPDVSQEQADEYTEHCNRIAMQDNEPDSIPPHLWLPHVWGCEAHERQSKDLHEAEVAQ